MQKNPVNRSNTNWASAQPASTTNTYLSSQKSQSTSNLPPLKETNKFSSWADKSLFDQVDELLFEQDSQEKQQQQKSSANLSLKKDLNYSKNSSIQDLGNDNGLNTSNKESLLSLSGSLDLDSYDIEDEVAAQQNQQQQQQTQVKRQDSSGGEESNLSGSGNGSIITDSLDLDNSDDLNKIIQKYETMLNNNEQSQKPSGSKQQRNLDESWGVNDYKANQDTVRKNKFTSQQQDEDYEDEEFEQHDEEDQEEDNDYGEDDDKLVEEEIYLNSSIGKKDSQFLSELLNQPIRKKQSQQQASTDNNNNKSVAQKIVAQLEGSGEYADDIDEFIKKHIENEELMNEKEKQKDQSKVLLNTSNPQQNQSTSISSSSSSDNSDDVFEDDKRTPKQILLDELKKLKDIFGKYSLTDREMFLSDFDNILKILSLEEVVEYVLPLLEIYNNEQEFLKLQFFQKVPYLFQKLVKPSIQESINLMSLHIFPLISKMLINSEEQVQTEGVEALIKIAKESLPLQEAQYLIFDLVQMMMLKVDSSEGAKIAVLMIVEKFAENSIFLTNQCERFLNDYLPDIQKGMLFKIKKFLIPTLLAVAKHISYDQFINYVYDIFTKFTLDDIWGKFISSNDEDQSICQSFMGNQNDDVDKIKYYWAFFIPAALLINGGQNYWDSKLKTIYKKLHKDLLLTVRKSLSSSLIEVMKLVDMSKQENQDFFLEVLHQYISDIDEIKQRISPNLCQFVAMYPKEQHNHLLNTLIREQLGSFTTKHRDAKISVLEQIYSLFQPQFLAEQDVHLNLIQVIEQEPAIQYKKRACKIFGPKVIVPLIKSKKYRKALTSFIDKLRLSKNFRERQLYLLIAKSTFKQDQEIFKKHFAKAIGNDMLEEKVKVVQILLAKICKIVPEGYSKSIDKVRQSLTQRLNQEDEARQYLDDQDKQKRQFLKYQEPENKKEDKPDSDKEQEILEKSVNIRFANYSSLIKGNSGTGTGEFGSLINSQLLSLLSGILNTGYKDAGSVGGQSDMIDKSEEALLKIHSAGSNWQS